MVKKQQLQSLMVNHQKANIVDNGDGTHTLTIVDSDGREYKIYYQRW